jgi:hypothetical protein
VTPKVVTIEVAVGPSWSSNFDEWRKSLTAGVTRLTADLCQEHDVELRRVGLVANRKHSKAAS